MALELVVQHGPDRAPIGPGADDPGAIVERGGVVVLGTAQHDGAVVLDVEQVGTALDAVALIAGIKLHCAVCKVQCASRYVWNIV